MKEDQAMQEISIKELFTILRSRIVYLIIIPLAVLVVTVIILSYQPDYYSATTKLYVLMDYTDTTGQIRYDTSVSTQFAGDFKELIGAPQVIDAAESAIGNAVDLKRDVNIDISAVTGTRVLNVTATSKYPTLSVLAANTISQMFVEYIVKITKADTITVASEAVSPDKPSGPARLKIAAIVYVLALLLVAAFFITKEVLDTTFSSAEEVEVKLGMPVLANIEDYRKRIRAFFSNDGGKQVISKYVSSITRESVKTLATNVEFAFAGRPMQSLMITSTLSTEGKSSLCILLAEALANDSYHVLLVDTDFRKPSLGKYLCIRNKFDVIDYVFNELKLEDIISETHHKRVDFIDYIHTFASTSHVYNYERFRQLILEAKHSYDVILFDTPPLGLFIDAAILAGMVDGTLLVVGKGIAECDRAKDVIGQLQKAKANLIGVVLNYTDLNKGSKYYSSKYYGQYNMDKNIK
jgi:capsular exopolysaccharide synthesis family protein